MVDWMLILSHKPLPSIIRELSFALHLKAKGLKKDGFLRQAEYYMNQSACFANMIIDDAPIEFAPNKSAKNMTFEEESINEIINEEDEKIKAFLEVITGEISNKNAPPFFG